MWGVVSTEPTSERRKRHIRVRIQRTQRLVEEARHTRGASLAVAQQLLWLGLGGHDGKGGQGAESGLHFRTSVQRQRAEGRYGHPHRFEVRIKPLHARILTRAYLTSNKLWFEPRVARTRLLPSGPEMSVRLFVETENPPSMTMRISYDLEAGMFRVSSCESLRDGEHVDRRQPVGDVKISSSSRC